MSIPIFPATSGQPTAVSSAVPAANSASTNFAELTKLQKAAGEFEAILLQTLWKSMKETFSDPNDQDQDPTLENFDDFGMQAMAEVVGSTGALGIKNLILKHLEPGWARANNVKAAS